MSSTKPNRGRPVDEGLWDRRTDEILDTAIDLFAERGYNGADTQEIANRVGVGKGTLYRYFPSKESLFLAAADRVMRRLQVHIDEKAFEQTDSLLQMRVAIGAFLSFFDAKPAFAELLILERALFRDRKTPTYMEHREKNRTRWEQFYQELIDRKRIRPMPLDRLSTVMSDLIYGTMFTNHISGREKSLQEQADGIVDIVFHGILTEEERIRQKPESSSSTSSSSQ
ncbi:TetR/AcrR family transcriptional regulator [Lacunimicrobium album]|jgi:AcrR family transcriptional regulator